MILSEPLKASITESLQPLFGADITIQEYKPVSGGCINNGGYLRTNRGPFFLKYNDNRYEEMFEAEARALQLLATTDALHIPAVYTTGASQDQQNFIILEWIGTAKPVNDFWEQLGRGLAFIHRQSRSNFGLDFDNYIGSLPQYNAPTKDWPTFFQKQRLEPQIQLGLKSGQLPSTVAESLRALYPKLAGWFPEAPPSLLHGDLWGGNLIVDDAGKPALIDPAVYYGHREIELAFTNMFGGFNQRFYDAYREAWPLADGFDDRIDLYNMYPLMVHVNLFGGPYLQALKRTIDHFSFL